MVEALAGPTIPPGEPQDGARVTYAAKIDKAEARLDFTRSGEEVTRQIRAFAPTPGAWLELKGERFKVLAADRLPARGTPGSVLDDQLTIACGDGAIRPTLVQRAGKPAMTAADLLRGRPILAGTALR
jgi:methionyl-tRNA formyltransferase